MREGKEQNYYEILGVHQDASQKDIAKAYKKKAVENHPDRGGSQEAMKKINNAKDVLNDEDIRKQYDELLKNNPVDEANNKASELFLFKQQQEQQQEQEQEQEQQQEQVDEILEEEPNFDAEMDELTDFLYPKEQDAPKVAVTFADLKPDVISSRNLLVENLRATLDRIGENFNEGERHKYQEEVESLRKTVKRFAAWSNKYASAVEQMPVLNNLFLGLTNEQIQKLKVIAKGDDIEKEVQTAFSKAVRLAAKQGKNGGVAKDANAEQADGEDATVKFNIAEVADAAQIRKQRINKNDVEITAQSYAEQLEKLAKIDKSQYKEQNAQLEEQYEKLRKILKDALGNLVAADLSPLKHVESNDSPKDFSNKDLLAELENVKKRLKKTTTVIKGGFVSLAHKFETSLDTFLNSAEILKENPAELMEAFMQLTILYTAMPKKLQEKYAFVHETLREITGDICIKLPAQEFQSALAVFITSVEEQRPKSEKLLAAKNLISAYIEYRQFDEFGYEDLILSQILSSKSGIDVEDLLPKAMQEVNDIRPKSYVEMVSADRGQKQISAIEQWLCEFAITVGVVCDFAKLVDFTLGYVERNSNALDVLSICEGENLRNWNASQRIGAPERAAKISDMLKAEQPSVGLVR